jgi:hypothetical protein
MLPGAKKVCKGWRASSTILYRLLLSTYYIPPCLLNILNPGHHFTTLLDGHTSEKEGPKLIVSSIQVHESNRDVPEFGYEQ